MYSEINRLKVWYEQTGQGRDLILLHGWGCDSAMLLPFARSLPYRVTLIDLPGHGKTAQPEQPMSVYDFADIVAGVCESLGIKHAAFMGHSNGGRTIIAMSRDHSALFDRLILCDPSGVRPRRTLKYRVRVCCYKAGKKLLSLPCFSEKLRRRFAEGKGSEDYKKLSPVMKGTFVRLVNEDLTPLLSGITAPTLLIWGENDTETPIYMAKIMEAAIPDCGLVAYENAGHFAFLEQSGRTAAILSSFMEGS